MPPTSVTSQPRHPLRATTNRTPSEHASAKVRSEAIHSAIVARREALALGARAKSAAKRYAVTTKLLQGMSTVEEAAAATVAEEGDVPSTVTSDLGLLNPRSAALAAFTLRRARAERCTGRILAISYNPEAAPGFRLHERFLSEWRNNPSLSLKIGFHGAPSASVPSICASGLRLGVSSRAFLGATIGKAMAYCDWKPPPGLADGGAPVDLPFTGKVVVCACLVELFADGVTGASADGATSAREQLALESPAFIGPEAAELSAAAAPGSTHALTAVERHLPLAVLTVGNHHHHTMIQASSTAAARRAASASARLEKLRCAEEFSVREAEAESAQIHATAVAAEARAAKLEAEAVRATADREMGGGPHAAHLGARGAKAESQGEEVEVVRAAPTGKKVHWQPPQPQLQEPAPPQPPPHRQQMQEVADEGVGAPPSATEATSAPELASDSNMEAVPAADDETETAEAEALRQATTAARARASSRAAVAHEEVTRQALARVSEWMTTAGPVSSRGCNGSHGHTAGPA
jgi:hypothetical protein